jgi:hypothetical protein
MITSSQIKEAYDAFACADKSRNDAEIKHGDAKRAYELAVSNVTYEFKEFLKTDHVTAQTKIRKETVNELAAWVESEKVWWIAQLNYRLAGYEVDSLNKQLEAEKLSRQ